MRDILNKHGILPAFTNDCSRHLTDKSGRTWTSMSRAAALMKHPYRNSFTGVIKASAEQTRHVATSRSAAHVADTLQCSLRQTPSQAPQTFHHKPGFGRDRAAPNGGRRHSGDRATLAQLYSNHAQRRGATTIHALRNVQAWISAQSAASTFTTSVTPSSPILLTWR